MAGKKKSGGRKYGRAAAKRRERAMRRKKHGTLKPGRGGKGGTVESRKPAIAIGLSEARKKGAKVPRKKAAYRAADASARDGISKPGVFLRSFYSGSQPLLDNSTIAGPVHFLHDGGRSSSRCRRLMHKFL